MVGRSLAMVATNSCWWCGRVAMTSTSPTASSSLPWEEATAAITETNDTAPPHTTTHHQNISVSVPYSAENLLHKKIGIGMQYSANVETKRNG